MSAKRSSTRNVVLSKAMKHVDEETRREFRERRLQALESDNYVETEIAQADEDAYNESDEEKGGGGKRKRAKANQKGGPVKSKWATKVVKPLERILMDNGIVREQTNTKKSVATEAMNINGTDSDEQVEVVQMPSSSAGTKKLAAAARSTSTGSIGPREWNCGEVNYYTIAAKPSAFPARQCFCSVCGYIGNYSCTRCGSKFCSIKCNESHRETRCFKFSM